MICSTYACMPARTHAPVSKGWPATMEATPETQPARNEWSVGTTGQDCVQVWCNAIGLDAVE